MKTVLKIATRIVMGGALLLAGFSVGFPVGERMGFTNGMEWAIVQTGILAREAGISLPVSGSASILPIRCA